MSSSSSNSMDSGNTTMVEGIPVIFPKIPYPCQVEYMKCTIQALKAGQNALLESPTGTGKTLSLLCSTLAWQQKMISDIKAFKMSVQGIPKPHITNSVSDKPTSNPAVIIYASRTHTQIAQVVKELKTTAYRPKMTVLGSRDQLCIHEKFSKVKGNALNQACTSLTMKHSCMYRNNLDNRISSEDNGNLPLITDALDIEDIVKIGKQDRFCPYFYSRTVSMDAELVLLPYNYLLDASMRSKININWTNSVVIFDEAHNIERVASDAGSFSLTSSEIAACIEELQNVLRILRNIDSSNDTSKSSSSNEKNKRGTTNLITNNMNNINSISSTTGFTLPTIEKSMMILKCLFAFENQVDSVHLSMCGIGNTPACILPGDWLKRVFELSGFIESQVYLYIQEIQNCVNLLQVQVQDVLLFGNDAGITLNATEPKLNIFQRCLERVFRPSSSSSSSFQSQLESSSFRTFRSKNLQDMSDYKVYICEKEREVLSSSFSSSSSSSSLKQHIKTRVINYWSFSPGVAMEDLKRLGVRTVIMTSGTLSPMDSFTDDMKLPFPIQLQNNHVISDKQVWVGAMALGSTGKQLNSSYSNRETKEYKDELGLSILTVCQTMIGNNCIGGLPQAAELSGGILVFFPSYGVMESVVSRWKETGLYNRLITAGGSIVMEPKGTTTTSYRSKNPSILNNSNDKNTIKKISFLESSSKAQVIADNSNQEETEILKGIVGEFESALKRSRRCILLAVCRGKVSEGIDFSDDRGRVVIITGLPYSPYLDPWIMLKKQYLNEKSKLTNPSLIQSSNSFTASNVLSKNIKIEANEIPVSSEKSVHKVNGDEWYQQSAIRAVNQAIGRVIRHKNDWGAIILLDDRFLQEKQKNQLSKWVRPRHKGYQSFVDGMVDFRKFISTALNDPILFLPQYPQNNNSNNSNNNSDIRKPISRPFYKKDSDHSKDSDIILRETVISDSDIPTQPDGITFIHPNLLLSQPSYSVTRGIIHRSEQYHHDILDGEDGLNIEKHFQRISSSQIPSSQYHIQPKKIASIASTISTSSSNEEKPTISSIFDRKSRPISSTFSTSLSSSLPSWNSLDEESTKSYRKLIYDTSHSNNTSSTGIRPISNAKNESFASKKFTLGSVSDIIGTTTVIEKEIPTEEISYTQNVSSSSLFSSLAQISNPKLYKSLTNEGIMEYLSTLLPSDHLVHYKNLIESTNKRKWNSEDDIESFVCEILVMLPKDQQINIVQVSSLFQQLVPVKWKDCFHKILLNRFHARTLVSKEDCTQEECLLEIDTENSSHDMSSSSSFIYSSQEEIISSIRYAAIPQLSSSTIKIRMEDNNHNDYSQSSQRLTSSSSNKSSYLPSKRAMAMFEATKENIQSSSQVKKMKTSQVLNKSTPFKSSSSSSSSVIPKISNFFEKMESSNLNLPDHSNRNKVVISDKLMCLICKEKATDPCAGKCGHICCKVCWTQWLVTKKACPLCRIEITNTSLSKIILK